MGELVAENDQRVARVGAGRAALHDDRALSRKGDRGAPFRGCRADPLAESPFVRCHRDDDPCSRSREPWKAVALDGGGEQRPHELVVAGKAKNRESITVETKGGGRLGEKRR